MSAVKVLIVDDSPVIREQMLNFLRADPEIEVLGYADGKNNAAEKIVSLKPDVITLNLKSTQDDTAFIKAISSQTSLPVVVITESMMDDWKAKKSGAVSFVKMPLIRTASTMEGFTQRLVQHIKAAAKIKVPPPAAAVPTPAKAAPAATVPTPVKAAPAATVPTPVKPAPAAPVPTPAKPAPAATVPTPAKAAPAATVPTPAKSAPAAAVPTPAKPAPAVTVPTPVKPVPATAVPTSAKTAAVESAADTDVKAKSTFSIPAKTSADMGFTSKSTAPVEMTVKSDTSDSMDPTAKALAAAAALKQKLGGYATPKGKHNVIALGASTGGTDALQTVLQDLPPDTPGIVIVQHMPEMFTKMYADRLDRVCKMSCIEARDGERVEVGKIILAAGSYHLRLARDGRGYYVTSQHGEKVSGHCPSVDVLFESVAATAGSDAIGAIFTGMGADGAVGLKKMRDAGAYTIGQDENSCVVYGMPMVAYNLGAVCQQAPLDKIAQIILENC